MSANIFAGTKNIFQLKNVMIDLGSSFNLIFKLTVAEYWLKGTYNLSPGLQCLDNHLLRLYKRFQVSVQIRNMAGIKKIMQQDLYSIDMTDMDMILGMTKLKEVLPIVNHNSKTF